MIQILIINGECCATALLHSQRDFQEQKGSLQEMIEFAGHRVIFYPKFHCELNFIERFLVYSQTQYVHENYVYTLDGLRQTIPASFKSISTASINSFYRMCSRVIDAYTHGYRYGTSHRKVGRKVGKDHLGSKQNFKSLWLGTPFGGVKLPPNNNQRFSTTTTLKLYFRL